MLSAILLVAVLSMILTAAAAVKFPEPGGLVNDSAGVLSGETEQRIEGFLGDLKAKTGAEVAVVTVPDMGGLDESTYAVELFEKWGIGSKERNDGILLLVAVGERRIRIEVGYGLEGIITDGTAGQIRDDYIVPSLRSNDYDTGILRGAGAIAALIARDKGVELGGAPAVSQRTTNRRRSSGPAALFQLIFIIIVFVVLSRSRGGRGLLMGMLLGQMIGGSRRHYGSGFGGGFGGGGGGGFGGFGGGMSGGGGASGGF